MGEDPGCHPTTCETNFARRASRCGHWYLVTTPKPPISLQPHSSSRTTIDAVDTDPLCAGGISAAATSRILALIVSLAMPTVLVEVLLPPLWRPQRIKVDPVYHTCSLPRIIPLVRAIIIHEQGLVRLFARVPVCLSGPWIVLYLSSTSHSYADVSTSSRRYVALPWSEKRAECSMEYCGCWSIQQFAPMGPPHLHRR